MASGSKERTVFTPNDTGKGKSSGVKTSAGRDGVTINCGYPQDNVHGYDIPGAMGEGMGGSETNLSHSLSGASAVQRQTGKVKPGI